MWRTTRPLAGDGPGAPACVMTDHRQIKVHMPLLSAFQGRGGPLAFFLLRQRVGAGGAPRRHGLFPAFHCWHDAGQLTRDQVWDDPHTGQASVEQ